MFSSSEYLLAWGAYVFGALLCFFCWWVITAKLPFSFLKIILRVIVGILFATPWFTEGTTGYLSPAIVAMSIEGLFVSGASFARAGLPLMWVMLVACVITSFGLLGCYLFKRYR